jgi:hypothetical protein
MIEAKLADGRVLRFPDGTDRSIIQETVKRVLKETVPSRTTEGMGTLESTAKLIESGLRQGFGSVVGIPRMLTESAGEMSPGSRARAIRGSISPEQKQQAIAKAEADRAAIAAWGRRNLLSDVEARQNMVRSTGMPETLPTEASGRIVQAGARGAGAGMVMGPAGLGYGALSGAAGQGVRETGAPEWAATATEFAAPVVAGGLMAALRPRPRPPTVNQLEQMGQRAYADAESAGLVISRPSMERMAASIRRDAMAEGLDPTLHPRATAALNRIDQFLQEPPLTLQRVDTLRQVLRAAGDSTVRSERRLASRMVSRLDEHIENLPQADVLAGNAGQATAALRRARDLWSRMRKAETIEDAVQRGTRIAASTNSGGNVQNAIRQKIRQILDSPRRARGFTAAERRLMETVVRGSRVENLLRLLGRMSPQSNMLLSALSGGGAIYTANPLLLAPPAIGIGAKALGNVVTRRHARLLDEMIRSGGQQMPRPPFVPPSTPGLLGGMYGGYINE